MCESAHCTAHMAAASTVTAMLPSVAEAAPAAAAAATAATAAVAASTAAALSVSATPPATGVTRIFLIRHGETIWNAEGRIQGQLDIPLNDSGRSQAQAVADELVKRGIADSVSAVVSSDLSRASETADIIARTIGKVPCYTDAGLREFNFGSDQGKPREETFSRHGAAMEAWLAGDFDQPVNPLAESPSSMVKRGLQALRSAASRGPSVVVVAHGGLIRWCSMSIVNGGGVAPVLKPDTLAMTSIKARIENCCCSTLVYDHATQVFHGESWFENFIGSGLDDTG